MPTTQHKSIELPEDVTNAVEMAHVKVRVLRDQEVNINKSVSSLKSELAELSISSEQIIKENAALKVTNKKRKLDFSAVEQTIKEKSKDLVSLSEKELSIKNIISENELRVEKLNSQVQDLVKKSKDCEEKIKISREKFNSDKSSWEMRKNQIIELLKTLK